MKTRRTRTLVVGLILSTLFLGGSLSWGKSVAQRITARDYPAVFQAWNTIDMTCCFPLDTLEQRLAATARHDLVWDIPVTPSQVDERRVLGAVWDHTYSGLATQFTKDSRKRALSNRKKLLKQNPQSVLLMELRWRDAPAHFLPSDSPLWKRDEEGRQILGWEGGSQPHYLLDADNPGFLSIVRQQTEAAYSSGLYDGVFIDWSGHLAVIKIAREVLGEQGVIVVNLHDNIEAAVRYKAYINGAFMEVNPLDVSAQTTENGQTWDSIREALLYFESNLRRPTTNCVEVWGERRDLQRMRAATTLTLTHSDGYVLYADPNPLTTPDHHHDWYTFWDVPLGHPEGRLILREDGAYQREFKGGTVVYNHQGNGPVTVTFDDCRLRVSNGVLGSEFTLADTDGDIFIPVTP